MLTCFEVTLSIAAVILLLPIVVYSFFAGSQPPENSPFAKYYRAGKYLNLAANLFLLSACANALAKLATNFGYIDGGVGHGLTFATGIAFGLAGRSREECAIVRAIGAAPPWTLVARPLEQGGACSQPRKLSFTE